MSKWTIGLAAGLALSLVGAADAHAKCSYQGTTYSEGATACQSGVQYRCDDDEWKSLSVECPKEKVSSLNCELNGNTFSAGSSSCQSGMKYRCDDGKWKSLETACVAGDAPRPAVVPVVPVPAVGKTCMLDGSTVSHTSTVCKSGTMFACDNGEWRNLGTPCQ
jgi:hypothetical protein